LAFKYEKEKNEENNKKNCQRRNAENNLSLKQLNNPADRLSSKKTNLTYCRAF
jgi:hypothetical protein